TSYSSMAQFLPVVGFQKNSPTSASTNSPVASLLNTPPSIARGSTGLVVRTGDPSTSATRAFRPVVGFQKNNSVPAVLSRAPATSTVYMLLITSGDTVLAVAVGAEARLATRRLRPVVGSQKNSSSPDVAVLKSPATAFLYRPLMVSGEMGLVVRAGDMVDTL